MFTMEPNMLLPKIEQYLKNITTKYTEFANGSWTVIYKSSVIRN